jgi:hypothetical protein
MASLLSGLTTDYAEDTGTFIISSMITKGVYAINDVNEAYNPMDLQLGTNGSINMIVGSDNNILNKPDKCLSIIDLYRDQTGVYNFEVHGSNAIALSPADSNTTVYIGDAVIYSDTDYVYLTSYTKKLAFNTNEISLSGSLHTTQDMKVDGEIYTPDMNITHTISGTEMLGYSFRINSNNQNLELVKYLNATLPENTGAQLVATFGQGAMVIDSNYTFNSFSATGTTSPQTGGGTGSESTGESYWNANGNDIYFGMSGGTSQRVGIHTSNPSTELDVVGTITGTILTDGVASMNNGFLYNIKSIEVETDTPFKGIHFKDLVSSGVGHFWNGHASNIYKIGELPLSLFTNDMTLSNLYTGTETVWFDNDISNITLSSFSNDLIAMQGDVSFSNITLDTMTGNELVINVLNTSNVSASNATIDVITASNVTISTELSVPIVYTDSAIIHTSISVGETVTTSNLQTTDLVATNDVTTNGLNVLGNMDASTITALINKLVSDQVETRLASISETLQVNKLATSNVSTSLIPDSNVVYDLGTSNNRWRDLYLSGDTMYLDDIVMNVSEINGNKRLNIGGGSLSMDYLAFKDGTTLASTNEIVYSVNEGELFGDFSSFTMNIDKRRDTVELFSGTYVYSGNHNIATDGNKWKVVEFLNNHILPINADGSGVDMSKSYSVKTGGLPKDVQVSFIKRNKFLGESVFFTHDTKNHINELFPMRNYDPYSKFFKNKCKADFHYFYNIKEVSEGFKCPCVTMYFQNGEADHNFVQINSIDDFNNKIGTNKFYDVEFMYFFKAPLYEVKYVDGIDMTNQYLISNDPVARLDKAYVYDEDSNSYILKVLHTHYGLYPRITIKKWDNSMNNTEFSDVVYKDTMGWGDANGANLTTVFNKFKSNGWLKELFKITYKYVKYGYVFGEVETFDINVDLVFNSLTADDIIFVDENNLEDTDGNIIENNTMICFKKTVFQGLI